MKQLTVYLIFSMMYLGCSQHTSLVCHIDKVKIDYVPLYVMTPMDVTLDNFYQYFGKSVKTIEIHNRDSILGIKRELSQFFNGAQRFKDVPDVRFVITLYHHKGKQIITMGSTLLYTENQGFIANDEIRKYFGSLTKLDF